MIYRNTHKFRHSCIRKSYMVITTVNAPAQRRLHPGAVPCSKEHDQHTGSEALLPSRHPVASHHDQLAWDEALGVAAATGEQGRTACAPQHAAHDAPPQPTPHPAVGATRDECLAWEAALAAPGSSSAEQQLVYAVVECGSHSTRLLLSAGNGRDIARLTQDTHLGADMSQRAASDAGHQQQQQAIPAAAAATLAAVRDYQLLIAQHQPHLRGVTAVATAAVREAAEGPSIAAAISNILNCRVRVLTGDEEAQLTFKGATAGLVGSGTSKCTGADSTGSSCLCLVVDMGGRSTEFAVGVAGGVPQHTASIPLGCLSICQAAGSSSPAAGPADPQTLMQAAHSILDAHAAPLHHITSSLCQQMQNQDCQNEGQQPQPVVVIATGGTVTTLAALQLQLQEYVHEQVHMSILHRQHIEDLMQQYLRAEGQPLEVGCSSNGCWPGWLTAARAATLAPGCAGLLAMMDLLGVDEVCVSDNDLLDGVVAEMTEAL